MFKKNLKRFVAIMLTAAMVIGSSAMAFGETGQIGDNGDVEGWVNKKVFSVLVPTNSANALKMLIDPQGLITETGAAAKAGLSANDFEAGAKVLFPNTEGQYKYSSTSDTISMANLGTVSVNYSVSVNISDLGGIVLSANGTTLNNTTDKAVLFVEMKKETMPGNSTSGVDWATANGTKWDNVATGGTSSAGAGTKDIVISENKVVTVSADVVPNVKKLYKVSWNEAEGYTYGISKNSVSEAKVEAYKVSDGKFTTKFHGLTNNGDLKVWKDVVTAKPKLSLVYNITAVDPEDEEEGIQDVVGHIEYDQPTDALWLGKSASEGLSTTEFTASDVKSVMLKYNSTTAIDVKSKAHIEQVDGSYWVWIAMSDAETLGVTNDLGTYEMAVTINNTRYTGTITFN